MLVLLKTSEYLSIPISEILGTSRKAEIVKARAFITGYLRMQKVTQREVAELLNKERSTVDHYTKLCRVDYRKEFDKFIEHYDDGIL